MNENHPFRKIGEKNPSYKHGHGYEDLQYIIAYQKRNPEKIKAQKKLQNSIASGKTVREPCSICGNPKSEAHHDDYTKPFDVRWLCRMHHRQYHQELKRKAA